MNKGFGAFLKWRLFSERGEWPDFMELDQYDIPPERVNEDNLRLTYVGHATVLIQTQGLNILFDPVWSDRASPVSWLGPKRVHPPGIKFNDLPPIDVVLVSHNHYDHLDLNTIDRLWKQHTPRLIVPLGNDIIITRHNSEIAVEAYDWGDSIILSDALTLHLEPMHHWSARGIFDRNEALWAAFVIAAPAGNIYLVGDTGYGGGDYFRMVKEKYGKFRVAVLPIGDYDPAWFMGYGHMSPRECVQAFFDLGSPPVLPIHYNTFPLADTGYGVPLQDLREAFLENRNAEQLFQILPAGQSWDVE